MVSRQIGLEPHEDGRRLYPLGIKPVEIAPIPPRGYERDPETQRKVPYRRFFPCTALFHFFQYIAIGRRLCF